MEASRKLLGAIIISRLDSSCWLICLESKVREYWAQQPDQKWVQEHPILSVAQLQNIRC